MVLPQKHRGINALDGVVWTGRAGSINRKCEVLLHMDGYATQYKRAPQLE